VDTFGFGGHQRWELVVTASVITTLPMIVVFLVGQRQIIEGISTTGTKG
jgi:multiple sugar transport system permease protein